MSKVLSKQVDMGYSSLNIQKCQRQGGSVSSFIALICNYSTPSAGNEISIKKLPSR